MRCFIFDTIFWNRLNSCAHGPHASAASPGRVGAVARLRGRMAGKQSGVQLFRKRGFRKRGEEPRGAPKHAADGTPSPARCASRGSPSSAWSCSRCRVPAHKDEGEWEASPADTAAARSEDTGLAQWTAPITGDEAMGCAARTKQRGRSSSADGVTARSLQRLRPDSLLLRGASEAPVPVPGWEPRLSSNP